ncbi:MAG: hypothetical protein AB7J35_00690 [Dehalococcoidia bacterium]
MSELLGPQRQAILTPVLSRVDYSDGFRVQIQGNRLEIHHDGKDEPSRMRQGLEAGLKLWPLVSPVALGVNCSYGREYFEGFDADSASARVIRFSEIQDALGVNLSGGQASVVFTIETVQVTLTFVLNARVEGSPGVMLNFNAHHANPSDIGAILETREEWLGRCHNWAKRIYPHA